MIVRPYRKNRFNPVNFGVMAVLIYCCVVYKYTYNFPYLDDFDAVLGFLNKLSISSGPDSFLLLFTQHNEHRIFLLHLVSAFLLKTLGAISFQALIFLGNLAWFFVVIIFWRYAKQRGVSFEEFIPVPLILLSFSHWGMMTWAMTSIVQYWQILFCILAIYFLVQSRFIFSNLFFLLAVLTGGGGLALVPLFTSYFLLNRSWYRLFLFALFAGFVLLTYFYILPYSPPGGSRLLSIISHPIRFSAFFFGFLGGALNLDFIGPISFIGGGVFAIFFLVKIHYANIYKNDFLTWIFIFILLCAFLTALNRSDLGEDAGGASHYSIYSLILFSGLYLRSIVMIGTPYARGKFAMMGTVFALCLFSYWAWKAPVYLEDRHHLLKHGYVIYPNKDAAKEILRISEDLNVFKSPVKPLY